MKLHVVLTAPGTVGNGGLWLLNEDDNARFTVTINGMGSTKKQIEAIAFALADGVSENDIEVPD
jgi:hypothetical protein